MIFNFTLPPFPDLNFTVPKIEIPEINIPFETSADSNFSQKTTNFSQGQTIYVRVVSQNDGTESHVLNLRDNNYNLMQSFTFSKNGDTYTASFSAPGDGTYSLEASIKSNGSVVSLVQTIKVGDGGSTNVTIRQTNNSSNVSTPTPTSASTAEPIPTSSPGQSTPDPQVLGNTTGNIFVRIWLAIANFWDNFWH